MNNRELLKRASASIDVLKGYVKLLDEQNLQEADVAALKELVDLAASIPLTGALRGKHTLTEG